ncbi:MAG: protoporphyrinogen oxidase HemJ [Rickettsiales bacterium]
MDTYLLAKTLHIISVISWMAGMLYLPRLFVYHAETNIGSDSSEMLKIMERKLLRFIMNPAMIVTWGFGIWLVVITGFGGPGTGGWMHAKFALVLALTGLHGWFAVIRKKLAADMRPHTHKFYRIINEIVTVLMVGTVVLVVFKPF